MNNADYQRAFRARQNERLERIEQGVESLRKDMDFLRKILRKIADPLRKDNDDKSDTYGPSTAVFRAVPPSPLNSPLDGSPCTPSLIPPIIPPSNMRAIEADFDLWWDEYPHKVGKGAARTKYRIARTKTAADVLLNALQRYKSVKPADHPWCNPATWLHQERWTDAPAKNGHINGSAALAVRTPSSKCGWPACSCSVRSACQAINGELHV